ncbi:MAG: glycosyltransferase family 4 protein [Sphingobium sp.]
MNIGYLVPEFPGQTHGFFWREIVHIEKAGDKVAIFSTRRPKGGVTHAFSATAAQRTFYLADFRLRDMVGWARAALIALRLMGKSEVRCLGQDQESWIKLFALAIIGARLSALCRRDGIDHIHGHSCADAGYVLAFSRLTGGPPFSLSLHGDLAVYGRGHGFKFGNAKFIACVTDALREQVRKQVPGLAEEPRLIRMGIELESAHHKDGGWSAPRMLKIVTVARLNAMKGHRHAIAAVGALIKRGFSIHYDIIGDGEHFGEIARSIEEAGLKPHVTMVGAIANDRIGKRLAEYDAYVLPSIGLGEAAPVAVMEAMSIGIPVVCSIIGGTAEMIQHERTGFLFAQGDETALADILARLAEDPELRKRVGRVGQAHAHAHFLTSVSAAELASCIRK